MSRLLPNFGQFLQRLKSGAQQLDMGGGTYDAIQPSRHRRRVGSKIIHQDKLLKSKDRSKLANATIDLQRNFAVAAWAIRKHLDYVSSFQFQAKTPDKGFNRALEDWVEEWSRRKNCDVRGKHPLRRLCRLWESGRTLHGDIGLVKLVGESAADPVSGTLNSIMGDRILTPKDEKALAGTKLDDWFNGVHLDSAGRETRYAVHNRKGRGGLEFSGMVPADSMVMLGYYDHIDQVRGVSPVASAINTYGDVYQGFDYALAKAKVAQLFGLVLQTNDAGEEYPEDEDEEDPDQPPVEDSGKYGKINFNGGPIKLELEDGEDAKFIESGTPASETVDFLKLMVMVALKSLDIPFSFFDESFTNFYGSRGGLMQYLKSCKSKREDLQETLMEVTEWRLPLAILDGDLTLPSGWGIEDLYYGWTPSGTPWWDPSKEARGEALSCAAGFNNIQAVCASNGTDWVDNIDRNAEVIEYAKSKGVPIIMPGAAAFNPEPVVAAPDAEPSSQPEDQ